MAELSAGISPARRHGRLCYCSGVPVGLSSDRMRPHGLLAMAVHTPGNISARTWRPSSSGDPIQLKRHFFLQALLVAPLAIATFFVPKRHMKVEEQYLRRLTLPDEV